LRISIRRWVGDVVDCGTGMGSAPADAAASFISPFYPRSFCWRCPGVRMMFATPGPPDADFRGKVRHAVGFFQPGLESCRTTMLRKGDSVANPNCPVLGKLQGIPARICAEQPGHRSDAACTKRCEKAITWPFGSSAAFEIEHIRWPRRSTKPSLPARVPLHAHGLARKLGEDHGVGFRRHRRQRWCARTDRSGRAQRTTTLSVDMLSVFAICARRAPCKCAEWGPNDDTTCRRCARRRRQGRARIGACRT